MADPRTVDMRRPVLATFVASIAYGLFWVATAQVSEFRAVVPFGEDPYDLVASVAIVLLPLVGALTSLRIARYGASNIPVGPVAWRVRLGLSICLGLVTAAMAAVAVALIVDPMSGDPVAVTVAIGALIVGAALAAAWLVSAASPDVQVGQTSVSEPDALDDLVEILPFRGARRERLVMSATLVRRHRALAGVVATAGATIIAVIWHAVREGAWATPSAALAYGGVLAAILLIAYGLLIGPLRVIRSA